MPASAQDMQKESLKGYLKLGEKAVFPDLLLRITHEKYSVFQFWITLVNDF